MRVIGLKRAFVRKVADEGFHVIASAKDEVDQQRIEGIQTHLSGGIGMRRFRQRPKVVDTIDFTDLGRDVLGPGIVGNLRDDVRHGLLIEVGPGLTE